MEICSQSTWFLEEHAKAAVAQTETRPRRPRGHGLRASPRWVQALLEPWPHRRRVTEEGNVRHTHTKGPCVTLNDLAVQTQSAKREPRPLYAANNAACDPNKPLY